ncbi:MAG TPA: hypothetical protein ENK58_04500 [Desulfobacterales bacterium]|nr:hypothetical protein [Desulfobacterales bacterium]
MNAIGRTMITRLKVRNYRSLYNIDMAFGPVTILAGPNGAGKSNITDALRFVRDALTRGVREAIRTRGGQRSIFRRHSARDGDISAEICLSGPAWSGKYAFTLESGHDTPLIRQEKLSVTTAETSSGEEPVTTSLEFRYGKLITEKNGKSRLFQEDMNFDISGGLLAISGLRSVVPDINRIYQFIGNMGFYNISPQSLRTPQPDGEISPLDEGGRNLCAVLRHLKEKNLPENRSLLNALKAVVPGIADYSVKSAGGWLVTDLCYKLSRQGLSPPSFELALESDGMLRMLGILTALYQVPPLPLLAIEEPELNIHPDGSGVLGDVLQEAGLRSQILVTTHSPDLIDTFPPDMLRIVEKEEGVTNVGPLLKSQKQAIAEDLFSPGELMRMDGLQRETGE